MLASLPMIWLGSPGWLGAIVAAAALYVIGVRYSTRIGLAHDLHWWRWVCFTAGLIVIFLALESPLDAWVHIYQTANMGQHILLFFAAPPLLLGGAPIMPLWRAIPVEGRRAGLRGLMVHPRPRRILLAVWRGCGSPRVVWVLVVGTIILWHLPALYDAAVANPLVHDLEHLSYLAAGLLFWAQIVPSPPLHPRMGYGEQALWVAGVGLAVQLVPLVLTFSPVPLYAHYAALPRTRAMPSALVDQTASGGLMVLAAGSIFGGLFMFLLWLWIDEDVRADELHGERWRTW